MNILIIGAGNMGGALLSKIVDIKNIDSIHVIQPSLNKQGDYKEFDRIHFYKDLEQLQAAGSAFKPDITVIAIKPQKFSEVLPEYSEYLKESLIISIAAGVSIESLQQYLGEQKHENIIRIMPNMAMKVGESMNLGYHPKNCSKDKITFTEELFKPTGKLHWLANESMFDTITPITGCSPAFFYKFAEILVTIAKEQGIEADDAQALVKQAFLGTALAMDNKSSFPQMINEVASKGGVTEAALEAMDPQLGLSMGEAFKAAMDRTEELGH